MNPWYFIGKKGDELGLKPVKKSNADPQTNYLDVGKVIKQDSRVPKLTVYTDQKGFSFTIVAHRPSPAKAQEVELHVAYVPDEFKPGFYLLDRFKLIQRIQSLVLRKSDPIVQYYKSTLPESMQESFNMPDKDEKDGKDDAWVVLIKNIS